MCQLLGMNCNTPTDICFSFEGFHTRGGLTDVHRDGWGIAFFEGAGCRLFLDSKATIESPVAELVRKYPIRSKNVIAHIRKATQGEVALENTHPFMRELWGRYWIFAHNGNLKDFAPPLDGSFLPVGRSDSERAFCWLLQNLRARFSAPPPREALFAVLRELTFSVAAHGEFNTLLSNGDCLFAHCATKLSYIVRQAPFSVAHLKDQDVTVDFSEVTAPDDRVALVATVPLTDNETWTPLEPGTLTMFHDGAPVFQTPHLHGRGVECSHPFRICGAKSMSAREACQLCSEAGGEVLWQDELCRLVLVADADYPGFCRVVWQRHVAEMTDLNPAERRHLMSVVFAAESAVRATARPDKVNLASLGNQVPHLHWHVVPRWRDDRHFPNAIWAAAIRPAGHCLPVSGRDVREAFIRSLAEERSGE